MNNLLNAGEVPNLFPLDEKQEICEKMRQIDRQRDKSKQTDGTPVSLFNFFVSRCRDQLHIVLAMSPIGDTFRDRLRKFPSLVNCCTIDWFQVRIYHCEVQNTSPPLSPPPPLQCNFFQDTSQLFARNERALCYKKDV